MCDAVRTRGVLLRRWDERDAGTEATGEEESEKVARRREGEVRLSHSGGVGVCLSSPLAHKQQKRLRGFYSSPSCTIPSLNSHLFIAAQVEECSALCSVA